VEALTYSGKVGKTFPAAACRSTKYSESTRRSRVSLRPARRDVETGEGIVRFDYGLSDKRAGYLGSRLSVRVKAPGPICGAKVLLGPNAQANGKEIIYQPQVAFADENSEEWIWYQSEELTPEIIRALKPRSRVQYFYTSPAELEQLRARLRELGFPATRHIRKDTIPPQPKMNARSPIFST
jgi:hypothetical protein